MMERLNGNRSQLGDRTIKVLVVDDSAVSRMHLVRLLETDPQIRVIGSVNDGQSALDFIKEHPLDAILMDIHMPGMDGFETTRRIMETHPLPIIICTATTDHEAVATTFRVLEAGAVACVEKPVSIERPYYKVVAANLLQTVRLMSEVKVIRRWPRSRSHAPVISSVSGGARKFESNRITLVGIGASTGGPLVLQSILASLPKHFPVPILVVQHIAHGFLPGLAEWLQQTTGFQIQIAAYGVLPLPGHVYLAPDGYHMGISTNGRILLTKGEPENGLRPAVSYLFRSMAETCAPSAVGIMLTGMGKDGAAELKLMKDAGATTLVQDRESSVVHGMPGEAIALGGATHILSIEGIASQLLSLVAAQNGPVGSLS